MKIEDEAGNNWFVEPGDAAAPLVGILRRKGYQYIVLPRAALCGILDILPHEPAPWPQTSPASSPEVLVRAYRLADCMAEIIKEKTSSNSNQ